MTPAATPGPSGSRRHYVAECLTPVVGSVGEDDSEDDERNAEIDRPPSSLVRYVILAISVAKIDFIVFLA